MVSFAPKLVVVESRRDLFNAAIKGTRGNFQLEKRKVYFENYDGNYDRRRSV